MHTTKNCSFLLGIDGAVRECEFEHLQVLNAVLHVAEQGCKWRGLPKRFGRWHTIYTRMKRWVQERRSRSGVPEVAIGADGADHDRGVRARLDLHQGASGRDGRSKRTGLKQSASRAADGTPRFILLPRMLERP
jgi:transposase